MRAYVIAVHKPSPYTSGFSLKQSCIALNFSTQSIPLGSCSENTKHENASRNCMPQGPYAIPPRHGQSQLIFPVTGSNAPPPAGGDSSSSPSPPPSPSSPKGGPSSAPLSSTRSDAASDSAEASSPEDDGGAESVSSEDCASNVVRAVVGFGLAKRTLQSNMPRKKLGHSEKTAYYPSRGQYPCCSLDSFANLGTRQQ